ncbi:MAG: sodium:solute symporter family protein [Dorea sp.]|nr:sodium:solute symporter family protein [Dorea sp.]
MSTVDLIVLILYLGVMIFIGFRAMKTVKNEEDFILGGRNVGTIFVLLSIFASWTGLSGLFGTPEYVYTYGIAGGWWWFTFPLGVFIMGITMAKILRRRMHMTLADIVDHRSTSKSVRVAASVVTVWNYLAWTAGQVAGIILIIQTFTDLNPVITVIITYLVMITFTMLGGFRAVVHTDAFQAILFILIIGVAIPVIILFRYDIGSIFNTTSQIDGFYKMFSSVPKEAMISWWLLAPAGFIDTMAFQRIFAAKDEKIAKQSIIRAFGMMIVFGIILVFIGVAARVILPSGTNPASAMLVIAQTVLPKGLLGLLIAALVGVAMSTASTTLLVCSATIEQDIYSVIRPNGKTSKLNMHRLLVIVVGLLALIAALKVPSVTTILVYGYSVYVPGLLLPVIAGTFEWKIPDKYMLATIVSGTLSAVALIIAGEPIPASVGGLIVSAIPFVLGIYGSKNSN